MNVCSQNNSFLSDCRPTGYRAQCSFVTLAYLIENKTSQNKTKTQSQIVGCLRYCKYLTAFNLFKFNEHRRCYDRMDFYCLQAVTLRNRAQYVDGSTPSNVLLMNKMFRKEQDVSLGTV